jgi:hypothetical protein
LKRFRDPSGEKKGTLLRNSSKEQRAINAKVIAGCQQYWSERGAKVNFWEVCEDGHWIVKSDLVNGLPKKGGNDER